MNEEDTLSGPRILYPDRAAAAQFLLDNFAREMESSNLVLAIPRGGVITGQILADGLHLPLDLLLCKKVSHPDNIEYAIGSVCADGTRILTDRTSDHNRAYFDGQCNQMEAWLKARYKTLTNRERPAEVRNKTVIITDDGLATGSTMLAAVRSVRSSGAIKVIVATPVASHEAATSVTQSADRFICPLIPDNFKSVGQFYSSFETVDDDKVYEIMRHSRVLLRDTKHQA